MRQLAKSAESLYAFPVHASDDLIRENAYLVERGVRPLAIFGQCSADYATRLHEISRIGALIEDAAIPFAIETREGVADVGVASHRWVIELFVWASEKKDAVPDEQRHRILGLLLGYDANSIAHFEERARARALTDHAATSE